MTRKLLITQGDPSWESQGDDPTIDVRKLLKRIPDDVVLSVSTRDLNLGDPDTCLCGWAVREALVATTGVDPKKFGTLDTDWQYPDHLCAKLFGGSLDDWNAVFEGVQDARLPVIEA